MSTCIFSIKYVLTFTPHYIIMMKGLLKSDVIVAGTMTGGGGKVMKGRMSCKLRADVGPEQLTEMERRLGTDETALQVSSYALV